LREELYNILIAFRLLMKLVSLIKLHLNEMYNGVRIGKYLPDYFAIRTNSRQGEALLPLLFIFAFEYAYKKVQVRLNLFWTCQHMIYADGIEENI
jgi:hypothetical protein